MCTPHSEDKTLHLQCGAPDDGALRTLLAPFRLTSKPGYRPHVHWLRHTVASMWTYPYTGLSSEPGMCGHPQA